MRTTLKYIVLLAGLAGSLSANSVLSCSLNGGAFTTTGCYSLATFSFTESLDWANAYGSADTATNPNAIYDTSNGPWNAITGNGVTVGATLGPGYTGTQATIARYDNFQMVSVDGTWQPAPFAGYSTYNLYSGMFDAQPDPGAGSPGDHLLFTNHGAGPLELDFSQGISGALFRISTPTSGDTVATVSAYAVAHPTALDVPIITYTIRATNASGSCATLASGPPVPCNLAPYIGIEGGNLNILSLVISTTDPAGLLIDTLYLDESGASTEVPEPGTFGYFSAALVLGVVVRRYQHRCRAAKA
jgi:hypothetical protein